MNNFFSFEVTKQVLAAVIRWALTTLGTFLVTKGIVDPDLADAFVSEWVGIAVGIILILAAFVWKWLNARFNILALITAVQTDPPADTPKEVRDAVAVVKAEVKANNTVTSL